MRRPVRTFPGWPKSLTAAETPSRKLANEFERAKKAASKQKQSFNQKREALARLRKEMYGSGIETTKLGEAQRRVQASYQETAKALQDVTTKQKQARAEMARANTSRVAADTRNYTESIKENVTALGRWVAGLYVVTKAVDGLKSAFGQMFETGDQFEKLNQQMTAAMGSIAEGRKASEWVKEFTRNTPLQLSETAEAFITLRNFGIDPMNGSMQAIVDQSEKLGGGVEKLNGIVLALGKAWAKEKLQQDEILQLVERGVPAWDLLAQATGRTVQELQSMSSNGELTRNAIQQLIDTMGEASKGQAAASMSRLSGLVSNLKDRWTEFLNTVAESGVLDYAKDQLEQLLDRAKALAEDGTLKSWAKSISDSLVAFGKAVQGAINILSKFGGALKAVALTAFAVALGKVVTGLGRFGAALLGALASLGKFKAGTAAATVSVRGLGAVMKSIPHLLAISVVITGIDTAIDKLKSLGQKIGDMLPSTKAFNERLQEQRNELAESAASFHQLAQRYDEYAGVQTKAAEEVAKLTEVEREGYQKRLEGLQAYLNAQLKAYYQEQALGQNRAVEISRLESQYKGVQAALDGVADAGRLAASALERGISTEAAALADRLIELTEAGTDASEALKQVTEDLDLTSAQGIKTFGEALDDIRGKVRVTASDIESIFGESLKNLSGPQLSAFIENVKFAFGEAGKGAERLQQILNVPLANAFKSLGVDLTLLETGISSVGQEAIDSFSLITNILKSTGQTGELTSKQVSTAYTQALSEIKTEAGKLELKKSLEDALKEGLISSSDYADVLKQSIQEIGDEADNADSKLKGLGQTGTEATDEISAGAEKAASSIGGTLGPIIGKITSDLGQLSPAAVQAFNDMQGIEGVGLDGVAGTIEELRAKLEEAAARASELSGELARNADSGAGGWLKEAEANAALATKQFYEQQVALRELVDGYNNGSISASRMAAQASSVATQFNLLDQQDLSTLNSAIAQAKREVEQLESSTRNTLASLRNELDRLEGNTSDIEKRNYQKRQAELEEALRVAQESGNQKAIKDAQDSLKVAKEIYRTRTAQIKEEETARKKRAEEEKAESERREKELRQEESLQRQQGSQSTTSRTPTAPVKTVRIDLGIPGQERRTVEVVEGSESNLIAVLQQAKNATGG